MDYSVHLIDIIHSVEDNSLGEEDMKSIVDSRGNQQFLVGGGGSGGEFGHIMSSHARKELGDAWNNDA